MDARSRKAARILAGLTQAQVAGAVEITQAVFSDIERGVRKPEPKLAAKIAQEVGVSIEALFPVTDRVEAA